MNFNRKVWKVCKIIPKGRVSTYKEISRVLRTKAYRAVGNALNKNPSLIVVPCHRVVNSDGRIGGFSQGIKKKTSLLEKEGVKVKKNKIINFEKKLFRF